MRKLRVCFVGCGGHASRMIYPSLNNIDNVELAAVCSRQQEKANAFCKRFGAEKSYTDYRTMLTSERPDAAIIVGPPILHYQAGLFCLENGIPYFVEKPPADNLSQTQALAEAAEKHNVIASVGFMMRYSGVIEKTREIQEKEALGPAKYADVKYYTSGPYRSQATDATTPEADITYLKYYLNIQAVHPTNLAASFLTEVSDIDADAVFSGENILVKITLRDKASDALANVVLHTFVSPGYGNLELRGEFAFEKGAMIFVDNFAALEYQPAEPKTNYLEGTNKHAVHWEPGAFGNNFVKMGYQTELEAFFDCVREDRQSITNLQDSVLTMSILDQVIEIVKQKQQA